MKLTAAGESTTAGVWVVLAVILGMIHFWVAEGAYRVAESFDVWELSDFSERITWPASWVYGKAEAGQVRQVLYTAAASVPAAEEASVFLRDLDQKFGSVEAWTEQLWEWFQARELTADVPMSVKYLIYGGTSLAWGLFFGLLGYPATRSVITALPERAKAPA